MVSKNRDREIARAKYERQQVRRQARRERASSLKQVLAGLVVLGLISAYALTHTASSPNAAGTPEPNASTTTCPGVTRCKLVPSASSRCRLTPW